MKVLVLGASGMLGHKLCQVFEPLFDVVGTIRASHDEVRRWDFVGPSCLMADVDALNISRVEATIRGINPEVVVNCIGMVKHRSESQNQLLSVWLNALFPHQLQQICQETGARLIHISTDCVFSGRKGNYQEGDPSDADDIYGKTKYLGEVSGRQALTIRTSLIGRELLSRVSLMEWFLSKQGGTIDGFTNAIFSGFPTLHFARILADVITHHRDLNGVYHVSSDPISKFHLLTLIRDRMELDIRIRPYPDYVCDRSLDSALFRKWTGFKPASWQVMIDDLAGDAQQYKKWRGE